VPLMTMGVASGLLLRSETNGHSEENDIVRTLRVRSRMQNRKPDGKSEG